MKKFKIIGHSEECGVITMVMFGIVTDTESDNRKKVNVYLNGTHGRPEVRPCWGTRIDNIDRMRLIADAFEYVVSTNQTVEFTNSTGVHQAKAIVDNRFRLVYKSGCTKYSATDIIKLRYLEIELNWPKICSGQ